MRDKYKILHTYNYVSVHVCSPTLGGRAVSEAEAKGIVLKMLAVASSHLKMQSQLSNERSLQLLSGAMDDQSSSNVTNAVMTLANIAQHTDSHQLVSHIHTHVIPDQSPRY